MSSLPGTLITNQTPPTGHSLRPSVLGPTKGRPVSPAGIIQVLIFRKRGGVRASLGTLPYTGRANILTSFLPFPPSTSHPPPTSQQQQPRPQHAPQFSASQCGQGTQGTSAQEDDVCHQVDQAVLSNFQTTNHHNSPYPPALVSLPPAPRPAQARMEGMRTMSHEEDQGATPPSLRFSLPTRQQLTRFPPSSAMVNSPASDAKTTARSVLQACAKRQSSNNYHEGMCTTNIISVTQPAPSSSHSPPKQLRRGSRPRTPLSLRRYSQAFCYGSKRGTVGLWRPGLQRPGPTHHSQYS